MKIEVIESLKDAIENQYQATLSAQKAHILFLEELLRDCAVVGNVVQFEQPKVRTSVLVRQVIKKMDAPFRIANVVAKLEAEHSKRDSDPVRGIIRNEINKMRYAGELSVVEEGRGSRSGVYQRK